MLGRDEIGKGKEKGKGKEWDKRGEREGNNTEHTERNGE